MRILITGALGLIGSEIVDQLAAQDGHHIIALDDCSHNAIAARESAANVVLTWGLRQIKDNPYLLGQDIDLVIHCASPVGHAFLTPEYHTAWKIVRDMNLVLEFCRVAAARLITFSSSETLTYNGETDIRSQYALGKLTSAAMALGHPLVDARVVLPYNVTGKRQRADGGFVMPRFRDLMREGKPLTIFGSGEQVRHFTHVSDFARFVLRLAEAWPEKRKWQVFNPLNGVTIGRLAAMFLDPLHWHERAVDGIVSFCDGKTVLRNPHWRDSAERSLDMREFEACCGLGWEPRVLLEQIVREHLTGEL